jgi:dinuclear metal center YbgI/SA1388 family protein
MKVKDITGAIEEFAPLSVQESWDNSGLIIGSPESEVSGVLFGFDCTPELVDEAVETGADMIVTHHPLIFGGIKKISPEDPVGLAVMKAVAAGISVYAAHTTADKVISGVSGAMAERLGLVNVRILEKDGENSGLGAVGDLPSPMSAEDAVKYVKGKFSLKAARCSRYIGTPVSRIAMCGGSGSSLIPEAMAAGAQLYVSGDISYHHFFTPQGFMVMDIGHFESEVDIVEILFSLIRKKFPNFAVHMSGRLQDANPVQYI